MKPKWIFILGACLYFIWGFLIHFMSLDQLPERSFFSVIFLEYRYITSVVFIGTSIAVFIEIYHPMRYSLWGIIVQQFLLTVLSISRMMMVIHSPEPIAFLGFYLPSILITPIHICAIIEYYGKRR